MATMQLPVLREDGTMGVVDISVRAPLSEPIPIMDVFADGLARVEIVGGNARFVFYALHNPEGADGAAAERVIVGKLVMPLSNVPTSIRKTLTALEAKPLRWPVLAM